MIKRLFFNLRYISKKIPWDSGITPPELFEFISQHPSGRAIDLGCGTGTNVITLAQHGWQVIGVDFVPRAIRIAKRKIKAAKIDASVQVNDVTKLRGIEGKFDLALDMGCFHNLEDKKEDYLNRLDEILAPNGYWLFYAHLLSPEYDDPKHGISSADFSSIKKRFKLISREDILDKIGRNVVWALFQKLT